MQAIIQRIKDPAEEKMAASPVQADAGGLPVAGVPPAILDAKQVFDLISTK